jgi:hypothetical protein
MRTLHLLTGIALTLGIARLSVAQATAPSASSAEGDAGETSVSAVGEGAEALALSIAGGATKTVRIVRTATAPVIDGDLDDAVWEKAAVVDDLHQVNPVEYAEPFEKTEIFLLYDDHALYVGAKLYDTEPARITANMLRQSGSITSDDNLFVTLDPFDTQRGGYFFGVNPNGVRYDGLYRNVSEYYSDWDGIYEAKAGRFDEGWTAEFAIPFKTLSFDPKTDRWGLNFSRTVQRKNEDIAWVTRNRRWDPSSSGVVVGFEGLEQGVGLDIVPSLSYGEVKTFSPSVTDAELRPSLDLFYKLTPELNAALTFNTDFSATEVDDRQVNLTRFSLFFPEKRDFFLRDADIFEFGRIGAQDGNGSLGNAERQNGRPFFSRRIGLRPDGAPVDLDRGGKISGRIGRFEIGALTVTQDAYPGVSSKNLSVVRAKANVVGESTIGVIFTDGDSSSDLENSTAGVDFLYRNSRFAGGRTLEAYGWYQRSETEGLDGDDGAAGVGFSMPSNTGIRAGLALKRFERNFNPGLGFVSRRGVDEISGHTAYTFRPSAGVWQSIYVGVDWDRFDFIAGGLESQSIGVTPVELTNRTGDVIFVRSNFDKEVLDVPFEISPGVVIPAGDYSFSDFGVEFRSSDFRKLSGRVTYIDGDFFGGTRDRLFGGLTWQPTPRFRGTAGYNINYVELPQGRFTTRLLTAGLDYVFSSTLSWVNLIQYDNVSDTMGVNMRLHWIPEAGRELFFVINHDFEDFDLDGRFRSRFVEATAKMSYTFRF